MRWLTMAAAHNLPRMVSIQNEYSLYAAYLILTWPNYRIMRRLGFILFPSCRWIVVWQICRWGDTPWSRRSINADLGGRINTHLWPALDAYLDIAKQHELNPVRWH